MNRPTPTAFCAWLEDHQESIRGGGDHFGLALGTAKWLKREGDKIAADPPEKDAAAAAAGVDVVPIPTVLLAADLYRVNDDAIEALRADPDLYQRDQRLVHAVADDQGHMRIVAVDVHNLLDRLSAVARWQRWRDEELEETSPPIAVGHQVLARHRWPGIRGLAGVVQEPILLPDGSILQVPGYNATVRVLYAPADDVPRIAERPSRRDAIAAAAELLDVVQDFPFESDVARAGWLAAVLTPFARFAYDGPAPLFLVEANVRGSGKSRLASIAGLIATGRVPGASPAPDTDDEMRKRITSYALEGRRVILLDNVAGAFGWPSLDAVLTSTQHADRLLGGNTSIDMEMRAVWFATANNAELVGDMTRRVQPIRLVSPLARPEERTGFKHPDLLAHVRAERPRLVAAALTVLRAYTAAGSPAVPMAAWGTYEAWSAIVRAAIVWIGLPDPSQARRAVEDRDERAGQLVRLLDVTLLLYGEQPWTPRELVNRIDAAKYTGGVRGDLAELEEVLLELTGARDRTIAPMVVGKRLNTLRDRVDTAGRRLVEAGKNGSNVRQWRVCRGAQVGPAGSGEQAQSTMGPR